MSTSGEKFSLQRPYLRSQNWGVAIMSKLSYGLKCQKTVALHFWQTCSYTCFVYVVKISEPSHSRSGYQVTSSDLTSQKVWMLVIATWNFQWLIRVEVSKMCVLEFWYWWPKVRPILWPPISIMSQSEKIERCLFWTKVILNALKH